LSSFAGEDQNIKN